MQASAYNRLVQDPLKIANSGPWPRWSLARRALGCASRPLPAQLALHERVGSFALVRPQWTEPIGQDSGAISDDAGPSRGAPTVAGVSR